MADGQYYEWSSQELYELFLRHHGSSDDPWGTHEALVKRIQNIEKRLDNIESLFKLQLQYREFIKGVEQLIEAEIYNVAQERINIYRTYMGDTSELAGLQAHIDMHLFLESENNEN